MKPSEGLVIVVLRIVFVFLVFVFGQLIGLGFDGPDPYGWAYKAYVFVIGVMVLYGIGELYFWFCDIYDLSPLRVLYEWRLTRKLRKSYDLKRKEEDTGSQRRTHHASASRVVWPRFGRPRVTDRSPESGAVQPERHRDQHHSTGPERLDSGSLADSGRSVVVPIDRYRDARAQPDEDQ